MNAPRTDQDQPQLMAPPLDQPRLMADEAQDILMSFFDSFRVPASLLVEKPAKTAQEAILDAAMRRPLP